MGGWKAHPGKFPINNNTTMRTDNRKTARPTKEEKQQLVSFAGVQELYGEDHQDLSFFLDTVKSDINTTINDLETAPYPTVKLLKDTRHKLKSICLLLELTAVQEEIENTIAIIKQKETATSPDTVQVVVAILRSVLIEIDAFQEKRGI